MFDYDVADLERPLGYHMWWDPHREIRSGRLQARHCDYEQWALAEFAHSHRERVYHFEVKRRPNRSARAVGRALQEQCHRSCFDPVGLSREFAADMGVVLAWSMVSQNFFEKFAGKVLWSDPEANPKCTLLPLCCERNAGLIWQVVRKMLLKWRGHFDWDRVCAPAADNPTLAGFAVKVNPSLLERLQSQFSAEVLFWDQFVDDIPTSYAAATEAAACNYALRDKVFASLCSGPERSERSWSLDGIRPEVTSMDVMWWWFCDPPIDRDFLLHALLHDMYLYNLLGERLREDREVAIAAMASDSSMPFGKIPDRFIQDPNFWVAVMEKNGASVASLHPDIARTVGEPVLLAAMASWPPTLHRWPSALAPVGFGVLRQALRFAREAGRHPFNYVPHFYLCGLNRKNFTPETNSDEEKLWLEMCGDIHGGHYEACAIFEFIVPIPLTERMGSPIKSEP